MNDNEQKLVSLDSLSQEEIEFLQSEHGIDISSGERLSEALAAIKEMRHKIKKIEETALAKIRGTDGPNSND